MHIFSSEEIDTLLSPSGFNIVLSDAIAGERIVHLTDFLDLALEISRTVTVVSGLSMGCPMKTVFSSAAASRTEAVGVIE